MRLKTVVKFARDISQVLGIALIIFVALEVSLSLAFYIKGFWHSPYIDGRSKADTNPDTAWVTPYYLELERSGDLRWKSYVYWRRKPYHGEYINIAPDGIRKTTDVATGEIAPPVVKVFMFGGSTMWGVGARDSFTIPSIFARESKNKGINCEVVNFGEFGYVTTQEVIQLMLQLQKGNIPDVVIFYDGVNDTFSAFQQRLAGLPQNEFHREGEFNLLLEEEDPGAKKEIRNLLVQDAVRRLSTVRLSNGLLKKLGLRKESESYDPQVSSLKYEKPISDDESLARAVVETYLGNVTLVDALSKYYGFKCIFYWQPTIYQKQALSKYERQVTENTYNYPGMKEFYLKIYALLKQRAAGMKKDIVFYNISSIFDDIQEPLFLDPCHLGEKGNGLIARRMTEDFARFMRASNSPEKSNSEPEPYR